MTAKLQVPYVGQVGFGADEHGNDCGPTCAAMVMKFFGVDMPSVDALFNEVQPAGDGYTSFGDICKLLDKRGIDVDYDMGVSNGELYEYLTMGIPVIALIHYDSLEKIRPNKFDGSHFVVVAGIDLDTVYINDPLNTPTSGEDVKVPLEMWNKAWTTLSEGNSQRQCLIPLEMEKPADVLRVVYPKDWNGCNVQPAAGMAGTAMRLFGIPFDGTFTRTTSRMQVYEVKVLDRGYDRNWGRIHPTQQWWVCLDYVVDK